MGNLRQRNIEPLFNLLEHSLIVLAADKRDTKALGSKTACTTDSVQIRVGVAGQVVVDSEVDALDINAAAKDVGCNADTSLELLEFLVAFDTAGLLMYVHTIKADYAYRSSWLTPECTAVLGKPHSFRILSSSVALSVLLTKMITWLNSRVSRRSLSFRFFSPSLNLM